MFVEAVIIPIIIGRLRKGNIKNLLNIYIDKWWIIVIAGMTEFIATLIRAKELRNWNLVNDNIFWIHLVIYLLLITALCFNINKKGFTLILIGIVLNFIVIMFNGGRMPVDISNIEHLMSESSLQYLKSGKDLTHVIADNSTKLLALGDIIHIPKPYPLPKTLSIGDAIMMVGIFRFIQEKMITR